jgi:predicted lipoprotein with Yx(FWY)xxD motif
MKRIASVVVLIGIACRDKADVPDLGGKSLAVPVPASGVAAATAPRADDQDMFEFRKRPKRDPSRLGTRSGKYGTYLVDGAGRALYVFSEDAKGEAACLTNCATVWPPAIVKAPPSIQDGLDAAQVAIIERPDGTRQLSYSGLPLYYSESDLEPDDTWGHYAMSFGGRFSLIGVDGKPLPPPKA